MAMPISDFCSAIIVVFFLVNHWKKLNLLIASDINSFFQPKKNQQKEVNLFADKN
jgi:hypothetical protein